MSNKGKTAIQKAAKVKGNSIDFVPDEKSLQERIADQQAILANLTNEENTQKEGINTKIKASAEIKAIVAETEKLNFKTRIQVGNMMVSITPVNTVSVSTGRGRTYQITDKKNGKTYTGTQNELKVEIGIADGLENGFKWYKSITTAKHNGADRFDIIAVEKV